MGEERAWKGKHVFFRRAGGLGLLLGFIGCFQPVQHWHGRQSLRESELLMGRSEYAASMAEATKVLESHPARLGDQALFRMGLLYAHPENPQADRIKAMNCFERILKEFPLSERKDEAKLWLLTLRNKDEELGQVRKKLKLMEVAVETREKKLKMLQGELEERDRRLTEEQQDLDQLRSRVAELEAQLSKLKNVDLTIEKKKRASQP